MSIAVESLAKSDIMKMYVVGYRTRKQDEPYIDPQRPWDNVEVQFSPKRGDWGMDYKEHASENSTSWLHCASMSTSTTASWSLRKRAGCSPLSAGSTQGRQHSTMWYLRPARGAAV